MPSEMSALSDRTELLIQALTDATMTTAAKVIESAERTVAVATDAAMARIEAGVEFAQMKATLGLRLAQLDMIGKTKTLYLEMRAAALEREPSKVRLLDFNIEILTAQEMGVLQAAGVPAEKALKAVVETDKKLYERQGRAFRPAAVEEVKS